MLSINKALFFILAIAIALLAGIFWGNRMKANTHVEENSDVVVEKIEKVAKLVTIESHLSEIYSYKDYYSYDWSFLRKKALLRVNAKVSAGYDLKKLNIKVDSKSRKVTMGPIPPIEILSIDHTLDYFDIDEGVFNSFTAEDYNKINNNAKEYIKKIAANSDVMKKASEQQSTMIDMIDALATSMGYQLEIVKENQQPFK